MSPSLDLAKSKENLRPIVNLDSLLTAWLSCQTVPSFPRPTYLQDFSASVLTKNRYEISFLTLPVLEVAFFFAQLIFSMLFWHMSVFFVNRGTTYIYLLMSRRCLTCLLFSRTNFLLRRVQLSESISQTDFVIFIFNVMNCDQKIKRYRFKKMSFVIRQTADDRNQQKEWNWIESEIFFVKKLIVHVRITAWSDYPVIRNNYININDFFSNNNNNIGFL